LLRGAILSALHGETSLKIYDLKPGMRRVDIEVEVLEVSEPMEITMSGDLRREILELMVKDETGSMTLVLWDDTIIHDLKSGDKLQIKNGFVTSYEGVWRINVGKYGEIRKT